jgi:hypothetical protein
MVMDVPDYSASDGAVGWQRGLEMVDKAISRQRALVEKNIARALQRNPGATPEQAIRSLERMYVSAIAGTGVVVGATAAAPGIGTGLAMALTAGETVSSLELGVLFALSLAEVHGVPIDSLERRRTIVMGILLGEAGPAAISKVAGRVGPHWARQSVARVPAEALRQINRILTRNFVTKYGTKQGVIVLGRVAPFGFGALIGGGMGAAGAYAVVKAGRRAFGEAPVSWTGQYGGVARG